MLTRDEWAATFAEDFPVTTLDFEVEKELCAYGVIMPCELEFGPHDDHTTCLEEMDEMRADDMELAVDYLFKEGSPVGNVMNFIDAGAFSAEDLEARYNNTEKN